MIWAREVEEGILEWTNDYKSLGGRQEGPKSSAPFHFFSFNVFHKILLPFKQQKIHFISSTTYIYIFRHYFGLSSYFHF